MALRWRRHVDQPRVGVLEHTDPEPAVADVVHELQDVSKQLRDQVARLERANDRVEESLRGRP